MRTGAIVAMLVIGLVVGAIVSVIAVFGNWLPAQGSEEREGIDFIFWLTTWICVGIFAVVTALLAYSMVKFRARPDDDADGLPIHGHTGIEIVWTAIPFVLVTVIAVASAIVLARNDDPGPDPLRVDVLAHQFSWQFRYPNGKLSPDLHLPVGRSAELRLRAADVIHSFWVPEFGQKQDAVPGILTRVVVTPKRLENRQLPYRYDVICTELCGLGHALMRSRAVVVEPDDFEQWVEEDAGEAAEGDS